MWHSQNLLWKDFLSDCGSLICETWRQPWRAGVAQISLDSKQLIWDAKLCDSGIAHARPVMLKIKKIKYSEEIKGNSDKADIAAGHKVVWNRQLEKMKQMIVFLSKSQADRDTHGWRRNTFVAWLADFGTSVLISAF